MSFVIYLSSNDGTGGKTRIIKDPQVKLALNEREYSDWTRCAKENEVLWSNKPKEGDALIFDHRILHDSEQSSEEKIIIRTDVIFERCGVYD